MAGPGPARRKVNRNILISLASVFVLITGCTAIVGLVGAGESVSEGKATDKATSKATGEATGEATSPAPSKDSSATASVTAEQTPTTVAETVPAVTEPARSVMPQVAGLPRGQAEEALAAAGLAVREVRQVPSAEIRGTVLRQGKQVGASLLAGSAIILVVAAPYPRVPSVIGQAKSAAVSRLQSAGFKVTVSTETRSSGKDGVVLSQTPAGSARARPGSPIAVVISSLVRPVAPAVPQNCTPGYTPCLTPSSDYDCAGGSGNGPSYAVGPIHVTGSDPYDLDAEGDGIACE